MRRFQRSATTGLKRLTNSGDRAIDEVCFDLAALHPISELGNIIGSHPVVDASGLQNCEAFPATSIPSAPCDPRARLNLSAYHSRKESCSPPTESIFIKNSFIYQHQIRPANLYNHPNISAGYFPNHGFNQPRSIPLRNISRASGRPSSPWRKEPSSTSTR